jgi:hypothetical protein
MLLRAAEQLPAGRLATASTRASGRPAYYMHVVATGHFTELDRETEQRPKAYGKTVCRGGTASLPFYARPETRLWG